MIHTARRDIWTGKRERKKARGIGREIRRRMGKDKDREGEKWWGISLQEGAREKSIKQMNIVRDVGER